MPTNRTLNECLTDIFTMYTLFDPLSCPTVFSTPLNPFEPRTLAVPASNDRDCYAAVGQTVYSGWTVTWEGNEVRV